MGVKLLWTSVAIFLVAPVVSIPAAAVVAGVIAVISSYFNNNSFNTSSH